MSVHGWENPFGCVICDCSFPLNSMMKNHVVSVHKEDNPFRYEIFNYRVRWKKHFVLLHEGEKLFGCEICDYICSLMSKCTKKMCQCMKRRIHYDVTCVTTVFPSCVKSTNMLCQCMTKRSIWTWDLSLPFFSKE